MADFKWRRLPGDILRPDAYSEKYIQHLRATMVEPNFDTFCQQDPSGGIAGVIKPEHFPLFGEGQGLTKGDWIVSIDTNKTKGSRNSNTVFLVWHTSQVVHCLMDMDRGQWPYEELVEKCKRLNKRLHPLFLIEDAALGSTLLRDRDLRRLGRAPCNAGNLSKIERLRPFLDIITSGSILLPEDAVWRHDYVREMTDFPFGDFDDCVDATSQLLRYVTEDGPRPPRPQRAISVLGLKTVGQAGLSKPPLTNGSHTNWGGRPQSGYFPVIGFRKPPKL